MADMTQNGVLQRDDNDSPVSGGVSSTDLNTVLNFRINPVTGRLLTDSAGGSGTVTSVSVATANGFAGTVATATTTPAITLTTTITGILQGNGTAISAITVGSGLNFAAGTLSATGGTGTVTSVSVVTAQGVSGSVATATTTPAITLTLGALTGVTSFNGLVVTANTGAITTGSWAATAIPLQFGGTGQDFSAIAKGGLISGTAAGTVGIKAVGANGTVLAANSAVAGGVEWVAAGGTGTVTDVSVVTANGVSGSVATSTTTPAITITLGAITPTTVNGLTITSTTGTFTLTNGKTFAVTNGLTLSGTDGTVMTFPTTSATIARTDAGQTFTGIQGFTSPDVTTSITTTSTSFTAFAGATTLLTIGGTGSSASLFAPSTLDATSSTTGAIRTSGGISAAKAGNIGTTLSVGVSIATGFTTTATAAGTTTMTIASTEEQYWTGTTTQTIKLPTTSVLAGARYSITNTSTGLISIQSSGANAICTLGLNQSATFNAIVATPTTAANWTYLKQNVSANTNGKRILTVTQAATPAMDTDNGDIMEMTGLAQAITSMTTSLTGTPVSGDMFELRITDNGTARALTFGASFGSSTVALPTTTVISTMLRILFQYDTVWRCIATA